MGGCHWKRNWPTNTLDHFVDIKSLKNYDSTDLRPKLQILWYFQEVICKKKPGIIKVKPKEIYHTFRTNGVWGNRAMWVSTALQSRPVRTRKWAELAGKVWVIKRACWWKAWVPEFTVRTLVRGEKWDWVGAYKELQDDECSDEMRVWDSWATFGDVDKRVKGIVELS